MPESVAVIGASARAAAFSVLRSGRTPVAADLFADADLRRVGRVERIANYPYGFETWLARQVRETPGIGWFYTGALENYPELVDRLAKHGMLLGNRGDVLRAVRSPWRLRDALESAGLKFPETRRSSDGLPRAGSWLEKSWLEKSWLEKTYRDSCGSGVRVVGNDELTKAGVYQQQISGTSASGVFVGSGNGSRLLGVTRQLVGEPWTGATGFKYCGSIGPLALSHEAHGEVERIGTTLAAAFDLVGLFGVDLIIAGDEVWTIEVNPRYTASVEVLERSLDIGAIDAHVEACTSSTPLAQGGSPPTVTSRMCRGKAVLYATEEIIVSPGLTSRLLERSGDWQTPELGDIPQAGTIISPGQPVLTVFAERPTYDEVERALRRSALRCTTRYIESRKSEI